MSAQSGGPAEVPPEGEATKAAAEQPKPAATEAAEPGPPGAPSEAPINPAVDARIEAAKRRLQSAAASASEAERRAGAEIQALEGDVDKARAQTEEKLKALRLAHEDELATEREARERAIAAAEERLNEIEAQAEAAEERIAEAEARAARVEAEVEDERARARESAAAWLRGQLERQRREG